MRHLLMIMTATCALSATISRAANDGNLEGQMFSLARQIQDTLDSDPRVMGQSLMMEKFDGEGEAAASNFGLQISKMLRDQLASALTENSKFILAGSYHYVTSADPATPNAKVLLVTAQIKNDRGKEMKTISVEINNTDNIFQVLGLTGAAPQDHRADFSKRNQAAQEAREKPSFDTIGTYVTAQRAPQWAMGILKKSTFNGPTSPVAPQNVNGFAFTSIGVGEYYEIELVNHDMSDAVANLTVDGLEVANTFSKDKDQTGQPIHWPGYLVKAGERVVIRGWLYSIDQRVKDNVFSFRVVDLGQGAASALKGRGSIGVITVQFREACEPNSQLSGRSFGETAKGEGLQEKLEAKEIQIGRNVLSTISIRYNRPE